MPTAKSSEDYSLTFEHRREYLYAYVSGEHDSYEISRSYWQEISDHLKTTDYHSVLVDEDIEEVVSVTDVFKLVSEFPQMGFGGIRIAFFDRKIEHHDLNEFGALVASNRGIDAMVFNDVKLAEEWVVG